MSGYYYITLSHTHATQSGPIAATAGTGAKRKAEHRGALRFKYIIESNNVFFSQVCVELQNEECENAYMLHAAIFFVYVYIT